MSDIAVMERKAAVAEMRSLMTREFRAYMVQLWVSFDASIKLLENADLFTYLEDLPHSTSKMLREWGNQMAHPRYDRYVLRGTIESGMLNLTERQREDLRRLFTVVHPAFEPRDNQPSMPALQRTVRPAAPVDYEDEAFGFA